MYDLTIVGAGPAGLAAAVYAARKRVKTLLLSIDIGGQINITRGVENYLGYQFIEGPELIDKFHAQVSQFPIEQKVGQGYKVSRVRQIEGGFEALTISGENYQSRVVILTMGKKPRKLSAPGEAELTGRGVTYCAICDGPLFSGQRVAVVGGGNSASEAALDMVGIAEWVYMVSLTPLTCDAILVEKLHEAKNLTVFTEYQTERILGKDRTTGIIIRHIRTGETKQLDVTGVFVEIGLKPNTDAVKDLVSLNALGEIVVNTNCETNVPGIFAAGDVTDVPEKQIVVAAGEGAKAALQAQRYLQRMTAAVK